MKNTIKFILFFVIIFAILLIAPNIVNAATPATDEESLLSAISSSDSVVLQKEIAKRTASFENMLKQYFKTVAVVAGMDYTMDLSDDYDVTIFDGVIRELAPFKVERDAQGKVISLTPES